MSKTIKELHILMGMPGCGKTEFALNLRKKIDDNTFSCVGIVTEPFTWREARAYMVMDGTFTTIFQIKEFLIKLYESIDIEKIVIHRWRDDIEACRWNNRGRTIDEDMFNTMMIDRPKKKDFQGEVYFDVLSVESHEVIRKPKWKMLPIDGIHSSYFNGDKLCSDSWLVSGCSTDYDGNKSPYTPENAVEFENLHSLLLQINPDFPLRYYLEIFKNIVSEEETSDWDYYSVSTNHHYECDMTKLYDYLVEKGIIADVV